MNSVNQEDLNRLVQFQQLERQIARLNRSLGQVDDRVSALDDRLGTVTAALAAKESQLKALQQTYRSRESDVQQIAGRIQKSDEKLRAAKTNKEYQSGLKEIDDLAAKRSGIEDEMLAGLEQIEAIEEELRTLRAEYKQQQELLTTEKQAILQEASGQRATVATLQTDLSGLAQRLPEGLLRIFNQVKSHHADGVGIAPVLDAVCQGCHLNVPPQLYNELQREESLKKCPHCERIIYWQRTEERSE